jgi:putative PIN family toxin of toxin-antitoxin system
VTAKIRVFFDTSVLFAAAYSATGAARDLIKLALDEKLQIIVSEDVLEEVKRNLLKKVPEKIITFQQLIELIEPEITPAPSKDDV